MSCSLPACHHQPLCPQMCSTCTCAGVYLGRFFPMKIRNKTSTAGGTTLPMDKDTGKLCRNGSGICVLNWVIICSQRLCASLSLQKPKQRPIPLPHPRTPFSRGGFLVRPLGKGAYRKRFGGLSWTSSDPLGSNSKLSGMENEPAHRVALHPGYSFLS